MGQRNFDNVSSAGSEVSERVGWVDDAAHKDSLDGVHEDLGVLDLLLDEVELPSSDAVVVDGEAF